MARYRCLICQYVYDEKSEGVPFDELPVDWTCPICRAAKAEFERIDKESGASKTPKAPGPPEEPVAPAPAPPGTVRDRRTISDFRRPWDDLEPGARDVARRLIAHGASPEFL